MGGSALVHATHWLRHLGEGAASVRRRRRFVRAVGPGEISRFADSFGVHLSFDVTRRWRRLL